MAKRIAGTCYFKVNGEQLELSGAAEAPMSTKKREMLTSATGVAGYKEEHRAPFIKGKFFIPPGFPRATLDEADNMTITAEFANGTVYTLAGAVVVGEPSYNSEDGTAEYEFNGTHGVWQ